MSQGRRGLCDEIGFGIGIVPSAVAASDDETNRAVCHYCYDSQALPALCPDCGAMALVLYGVGTERIESLILSLRDRARWFVAVAFGHFQFMKPTK